MQAVDTDGNGVLDYASSIDDDEKRADVLAVLAEHGLKLNAAFIRVAAALFWCVCGRFVSSMHLVHSFLLDIARQCL